jgi:hypothetical protein
VGPVGGWLGDASKGGEEEEEHTEETILRSINNRTGACKPSILRWRVNFKLS